MSPLRRSRTTLHPGFGRGAVFLQVVHFVFSRYEILAFYPERF